VARLSRTDIVEPGAGARRRCPGAGLGVPRAGYLPSMEYGTSIFLIAVGAILKFAVNTTVSGISLQTVGVILMLVGLLGLLLSFFWLANARGRRDVVVPQDRVVERERPLI